MSIEFAAADVEGIRAHAREMYPDECCGFLLGKSSGGAKRVRALLRASNVREAAERYHRFVIAPEAFLAAEKKARAQGQEILGFYHSHPDAPARPSRYDVEHAWPWYSYIIVSVSAERAGEPTAWVLEEDRSQFFAEELIIRGEGA